MSLLARRVVRDIGRAAAWLANAVLVAGWLLIASLYVRGALILGHWPFLSRNDPKDLGLGLHYELVGYALFAVFVTTVLSFVLGIVLVGVGVIKGSWQVVYIAWWRGFVPALLSVVLWVLFPFVSWWLD